MKRTAIAIAVGALSTGLSHGLLAQDAQDEDSQQHLSEQQQMSEENAQNQNNQSGSGSAEIQVEEEPADINVDQEPAEVQVEQEPPDVTVEQNPPEVTIEQQDPNVTVDQAEPDVTVEQTGEPNVEVDPAEEAEAEIRSPDEQQDSEEQSSDQASQDQASQANNVMTMQVSELEGQTVYSQENDEEIGEVERVVRDTESNEAYVVISEGGFLGFGEDEMGYPVDELEIRNEGELVVQSSDSGESGDYGSDQYEEIDDNQTLQEAMQSN
ncbi:PRC-barrel domain-containing protein [Billgrantia saliphila]|uniref:PRC-barrel domain-containing protein n=1 Tax=Billgrantia saliphila TaxID=1848458 RepID=UPI000CE2BC1D|nr:PRC-barrel domain-containing protein [Halomonas saliphila]